jgi:hypothetical protein
VSTNNGTAYYPSLTNRYVWDNQVLLAVLDHTNGVVVSFMRGLDLSGTVQGAGGVGGVLAVQVGSAGPAGLAGTTHFTCYDGNGNVTALVNAATGEESARYAYGPFAEPLQRTGPMAKLNPIRFSTQYHDDYTGDDKYLFRDLRDGRWPNRDPLDDEAFFAFYTQDKSRSERRQFRAEALKPLYVFVSNDPANKYDYMGLQCGITVHRAPVKVGLVWDWPPIDINAGHEWIEIDGKGYGFWPAGSALYSDGKFHDGDDPYTGNRSGRNWDLECKKTCIRLGKPWTQFQEGTMVTVGMEGSRGVELTIIQAGSGKDKKCADAGCDDIKSCVKAVAEEWKTGKTYCLPATNCRDFVSDVIRRCALSRASQTK